VRPLRSFLGATGPGALVAFRHRGGAGSLLVETAAPGAMLAYLVAPGHAGAAASQGDTVYSVQNGRVAAHAAASARFRELRASVSGRSLTQTAAELLGARPAHAACP
jgi:hypothetical protein